MPFSSFGILLVTPPASGQGTCHLGHLTNCSVLLVHQPCWSGSPGQTALTWEPHASMAAGWGPQSMPLPGRIPQG